MITPIHEQYPKQFDFFQKALKSERVAHSYIFFGPQGNGKKDFTKFLVQYLQCLDKKDQKPCKNCQHCRLAESRTFIDSYIIEKGTENILIDDIRGAQKNINLSRSGGEWKFLIINDAEKMTDEACEALLKTLEEPPDKSIIILLANEKKNLPKTILSRAQSLYFHQNFFFPKDEEAQESIAICRDLLSEKSFPKMLRAKELSEKEDPQKDLEALIIAMRNLALHSNKVVEISDLEKNLWGGLEKTLQYGRIAEVLKKLLKARDGLESNVSKRVFFENLFISDTNFTNAR